MYRPIFTVALVCLCGRPAAGTPAIRLVHRGSCPDLQQIAAALGSHARIVARSSSDTWTLEVTPAADDAGGIDLELRAPVGDLALRRHLPSADCRALAGAIGLIVQTYFVAYPVERERLSPPDSEPPARAPTLTRRRAPPRRSAAPLRLTLGAAGGVALAAAPSLWAGTGQIDIGLQKGWLALGLAAMVESPTEQQTGGDRVQRWESRLRLEAGPRLGRGRAWIQPALAVGVAISRVTALDLGGRPSTVRAHPLVGAVVSAGLQISPRWSARAQLAGQAYPTSDRYLVAPTGAVARTPRASFSLGLGLQAELPL